MNTSLKKTFPHLSGFFEIILLPGLEPGPAPSKGAALPIKLQEP